jgi:hypothetical protein
MCRRGEGETVEGGRKGVGETGRGVREGSGDWNMGKKVMGIQLEVQETLEDEQEGVRKHEEPGRGARKFGKGSGGYKRACREPGRGAGEFGKGS